MNDLNAGNFFNGGLAGKINEELAANKSAAATRESFNEYFAGHDSTSKERALEAGALASTLGTDVKAANAVVLPLRANVTKEERSYLAQLSGPAQKDLLAISNTKDPVTQQQRLKDFESNYADQINTINATNGISLVEVVKMSLIVYTLTRPHHNPPPQKPQPHPQPPTPDQPVPTPTPTPTPLPHGPVPTPPPPVCDSCVVPTPVPQLPPLPDAPVPVPVPQVPVPVPQVPVPVPQVPVPVPQVPVPVPQVPVPVPVPQVPVPLPTAPVPVPPIYGCDNPLTCLPIKPDLHGELDLNSLKASGVTIHATQTASTSTALPTLHGVTQDATKLATNTVPNLLDKGPKNLG